ncbi:hypothetical protein B0F90DRAFT_1353214 [Multifurca ochricompacta]|uniref:Uncharacterized protein n=1 Tax=Multifurca ochricompacta TaxID=376703 RepID=A0AAD4QKB6_9AGAM|nr:hypothetical protein B0F90DRAFT_1353214 [Multifurca ochricompacta]
MRSSVAAYVLLALAASPSLAASSLVSERSGTSGSASDNPDPNAPLPNTPIWRRAGIVSERSGTSGSASDNPDPNAPLPNTPIWRRAGLVSERSGTSGSASDNPDPNAPLPNTPIWRRAGLVSERSGTSVVLRLTTPIQTRPSQIHPSGGVPASCLSDLAQVAPRLTIPTRPSQIHPSGGVLAWCLSDLARVVLRPTIPIQTRPSRIHQSGGVPTSCLSDLARVVPRLTIPTNPSQILPFGRVPSMTSLTSSLRAIRTKSSPEISSMDLPTLFPSFSRATRPAFSIATAKSPSARSSALRLLSPRGSLKGTTA